MDDHIKRYDLIISKIKKAREENNKRSLKLWTNKLNKWCLEFGASSPNKYRQKY